MRVAGPFTVESLIPHRVLGVDEDDELIDPIHDSAGGDERYASPSPPAGRMHGAPRMDSRVAVDGPWPEAAQSPAERTRVATGQRGGGTRVVP